MVWHGIKKTVVFPRETKKLLVSVDIRKNRYYLARSKYLVGTTVLRGPYIPVRAKNCCSMTQYFSTFTNTELLALFNEKKHDPAESKSTPHCYSLRMHPYLMDFVENSRMGLITRVEPKYRPIKLL